MTELVQALLRGGLLALLVGGTVVCTRDTDRPAEGGGPRAPSPIADKAARIVAVACGGDNYAYVVHASPSKDAIVVDPTESGCVRKVLDREHLGLAAILNTHHHRDHTEGNAALVAAFPSAEVIVGEADRAEVRTATRGVTDGIELVLAGVRVRAIATPGHTDGSTVFQVEDAIFTGDTLFVGGCGRVFEGTAEQMLASLQRLSAMPPATKVYPSHDYAMQDAVFALTIDPDNEALKKLASEAARAGAASKPLLPTTIADELSYNPFLRVEREPIRSRYGAKDPVQVFGALRKEKNEFRR